MLRKRVIYFINILEKSCIIAFYLIFLTYFINSIYIILNALSNYNSKDFIYMDKSSIIMIIIPIASLINCYILLKLNNHKHKNFILISFLLYAFIFAILKLMRSFEYFDKLSLYMLLWISINGLLIKNYISNN